MVHADLFFSFRSPYSYLSLPQWRAILNDYALDLSVRPVWPLAIREPDFFERRHPNWLRYTMLDVLRVATMKGIAIAPPRPDPIVQDIATRAIAAEQPHIHRLVRLGQVAARHGRGFAFAEAAMTLIWGGTEGWDQGSHLADAAAAAGLDLAVMDGEILADVEGLDCEIAANQAALETSGHWGVPTLVFNGEPFFGQDRIEAALERMRQAGLEKR